MPSNPPPPLIEYHRPVPNYLRLGNGPAIASMVFGITAVALLFRSCLVFPLGVLALLVGISTLCQFQNMSRAGIGMAIAGTACGGCICVAFCANLLTYFSAPANPAPLMPKGFSTTYYSMPTLTPELSNSVKTTGIYANGHLQRLRIVAVSAKGRLSYAFGLQIGDEVTATNFGLPINQIDNAEAATARMIASCENGEALTVVRDGRMLTLKPNEPTSKPLPY